MQTVIFFGRINLPLNQGKTDQNGTLSEIIRYKVSTLHSPAGRIIYFHFDWNIRNKLFIPVFSLFINLLII
jgi:hypothetical protein